MDELNIYHWWQIATGAVAIIASIAVAIVSFIQNKHSSVMEKINTNQEQIITINNTHSNCITSIETQIKNMPAYQNMEKVNNKIHEVDNKVSDMAGQLKGIQNKLNMIDKHLLNKK